MVNQILDKKGASRQKAELIKKPNMSGMTALQIGLIYAKHDLCKILVDILENANIHSISSDHESLFFQVLTSNRSRSEISRFLKEFLKVTDENKAIAKELFDLVNQKQVKKIDLLMGKILKASWKGQSRENLEVINWKDSDNNGLTALHLAAAYGLTSTCEALLRAGADPDILGGPSSIDPDICTADENVLLCPGDGPDESSLSQRSHLAASSNKGDEAMSRSSNPSVNIAVLTLPNPKEMCTALYLAAEHGHSKVCQILLSAKADPNKCVRPVSSCGVQVPSLLYISETPNGKYDGVYWINARQNKYMYIDLFDTSKKLLCGSKLDISNLKIVDGTRNSIFNYSYNDERQLEWYVCKDKGISRPPGVFKLNSEPSYHDLSTLYPELEFIENIELLKLNKVVTRFEQFSPLSIAAEKGFDDACRLIFMFHLNLLSKQGTTVFKIPDKAIEIYGAGEVGANGIYVKEPTASVFGGGQIFVEGTQSNYTFAYTHTLNVSYRLLFQNTEKAGNYCWKLMNGDEVLYTVEGFPYVMTLLFGEWLPTRGTHPMPEAKMTGENEEHILRDKSVYRIQDLFEFLIILLITSLTQGT